MTAPAAKTRQRVAPAASASHHIGAAPPDLLDRFEALERVVADQARVNEEQAARITELERLVAHPAESEDGAPRPAGNWLRMKAAAGETGYSESGLRRLCRLGRCVADYSGPHLLINVDSVPRRSVKVSKVQS
jgi:hypothetical protein